jgi:hypothetical protein
VQTSSTTSSNGAHGHVAIPRTWRWRGLDEKSFFSRHPGVDTGGTDYIYQPTATDPDHSHTMSLNDPGGTTTENSPQLRPAWFALLYVMKKYA